MSLSVFSPSLNRRPSGRRGVVTLELILWLPIMIIFLLAIVEFALIMQFNQQVAYAARFGAKLAAEIQRGQPAGAINLSNFNLTATANNLKDQVDTYLANHGISASCEVRLDHNACVENTSQVDTDAACNCGASAPALPAGEPPADEAYVKVTVCVKLAGNVPNCLSTFGFDLNGPDGIAANADDCTIEHSTVFRVETENTPPNTIITTDSTTAGTPSVALPADDPPNDPIRFTFNRNDGTTSLQVTFNDNNTTDEATAFANFVHLWGTTGTPISGTTAATFVAEFSVPGTPSAGMNPGSAGFITRTVNVTVTDSCNESTTQQLTVEIQRL